MTSLSTNLGLILYNNTTDQSGSFLTWTQNMSGSDTSNMKTIDRWAGQVSASFIALSGSVSASMTNLNNQATSISGSITTLNSNITTILGRLEKLDEFTGAGQADFTGIGQTHKHLLIIGTTCAGDSRSEGLVRLGIDFNGDANSANYASTYWYSVPTTPTFEVISTATNIGSIQVGYVNNYAGGITYGYGTTVFAIIPNYSGSSTTGFYKNASGFTATYLPAGYGGGQSTTSLQGGVWKSRNAITRLRIFTLGSDSDRRNLGAGTVLSLYGFG